MTFIYALADPRTRDVRYVGKTSDLDARLNGHQCEARRSPKTTPRLAWLRMLATEGIRPEILVLEEVSDSSWQERERYWIKELRRQGAQLTNSHPGGLGGASPEMLDRVHEANRGSTRTQETRDLMSESAKRRCQDPAERERLRSIGTSPPPIFVGETNRQATLSDAQVVELRLLAADGMSGTELARRFGVTPATVSNIATGRTRKSAGGPMRKMKKKQRLSDADVEKIRSLRSSGMKNKDIAYVFEVDPSHVSKIISNSARTT